MVRVLLRRLFNMQKYGPCLYRTAYGGISMVCARQKWQQQNRTAATTNDTAKQSV